MFTKDQITEIVRSQLHTLLWSAGEICDENGDPANDGDWEDIYSSDDATPELVVRLTQELFPLSEGTMTLEMFDALVVYEKHFGSDWPNQFGHDLALTRNDHGAGFWSRGLGLAGDVLTGWADTLGELYVFHGHASIHPDKWAGMFHAE